MSSADAVTFPQCVPVLTDGVVRLRAHRSEDSDAIVEQCGDPESVRWTTAPRPYTHENARELLGLIADGWGRWDAGVARCGPQDPCPAQVADGHCSWAVEWLADPAGPRFAGTVDLRPRGQGSAEIGYALHPRARGHGLMTAAVRLVCEWWFDGGGRRVTWFANAGNEASWRVARACGFTRHGDLPEYLPHPDGLADAWTASLGAGDDLRRSVTSEPVVAEREDTRTDGPMTGAERELLEHWLDLYRETVLLKIAGLDAEQLARRSVPPSTLSLLGLVRHLTEVEAYWLRQVLLGQEVSDPYCTPESPDGDIEDARPGGAAADVAAYEAEVARTREFVAAWTDLDGPVRGLRRGRPVNLRWILTHLIEEYARHLGHMDLLRETVDGRTGY
ncbi:GNAT family N-acetyltransferase [Agilicoccus flavus]|uniref:GNAT family N-acetyltransferase n=1 Tax=Agilicoccus flavus TaxID=2775968 RepID=UPI001CF699FC|nr:GNAT family N-acetyltransferase [Agilicoccus flavus]